MMTFICEEDSSGLAGCWWVGLLSSRAGGVGVEALEAVSSPPAPPTDKPLSGEAEYQAKKLRNNKTTLIIGTFFFVCSHNWSRCLPFNVSVIRQQLQLVDSRSRDAVHSASLSSHSIPACGIQLGQLGYEDSQTLPQTSAEFKSIGYHSHWFWLSYSN